MENLSLRDNLEIITMAWISMGADLLAQSRECSDPVKAAELGGQATALCLAASDLSDILDGKPVGRAEPPLDS